MAGYISYEGSSLGFKSCSDLTDILSGEEHVIVSCLKPLLNHLHREALAEKEGDTTLKSDIQKRIKEHLKAKYDDESIMSTLNISCCLGPIFMLKYCNDDEAMATRQSIIQQGIVTARQMEEQQPPRPSAGGENERQEESTDVSAAPAKKRRLVDFF